MSEKMSDLHRDRQGRRWRREGERVVYYAFPSFSEVHQLWDPRQPHTFVFVGFVKFGQGLEVLLRAIAMLRGLWPDVHLDVIGTGPDLDAARDLARSLSLGSCVEFHGFLPDAEMHLKVARAAAGAALFDPRVAVHSAYTVSSKAFLYVGCGTPVVINRGTGSYEDIVGAQAGVGVEYTPDSVADGLRRVASTADANRKFREAARRMAGVAGKNAEALTLAVKECAS
jgi:glycosyltransferase involved in cell wall biosynthesis